MKFPSDVQFLEEVRLLIFRPHGTLDEDSLNKIVDVIGELEAFSKEPFNRFWDATNYAEVNLNFRVAANVSLYRRLAYSDRPSIKSAILAIDRRIIHYANLLAFLTRGSPIQMNVFQERSAAADWLAVPVELLAPRSNGAS
jgi:hypothetical protein